MDKFISPIDERKPITQAPELLIIKHYLEASKCRHLITYADWCPTSSAPVADLKADGDVGIATCKTFIADRIEFITMPAMHNECLSIMVDVFRNVVGQHYGDTIEWFEYPHILRYKQGGTYFHHSDSDKWDQKTNRWIRSLDRDYSVIIYLNSDFTGGSLAFPHFNLRITPQTGMLVAFPSDYRFVHNAEPVISGQRYAMVTWAAKLGGERIMNRLPNKLVYLGTL